MILLFAAASALVIYVFFGYPVLLGWLARGRAREAAGGFRARRVTVLVAAHNAVQWIEAKLRTLHELDYPPECMDIVVVSDGSDDGTEQRVRDFGSSRARLVRIPRGGKAKAINAGLEEARGEIVFFTDVRQRLEARSLRYLVENFNDPRVGAVSGELMIEDGETGEGNAGLYWRYEKWIRKRQSALDSVMGATGCIYAMRRELVVKLPDDCLLDDVYLPLEAFFRGYRIVFEERAKAYDRAAPLENEFRRKVRTLAGNYQLFRQRPELFTGRNRMLLHFLSHKVGRLLVPWALIGIAVSTVFLPPPWEWGAGGMQAAVYGLAAADAWLPERLRRVSAPCRTFVVLMGAALAAVAIFFRPSGEFWKTQGGRR